MAPKTGGSPEKPADLGEVGAAFWDSIIADLEAMGVASKIDTAALHILCDWWERYHQCKQALSGLSPQDEKFYRGVILTQICWKAFAACAAEFGLTPSSRSRLRIQPPQPNGVKSRVTSMMTRAQWIAAGRPTLTPDGESWQEEPLEPGEPVARNRT